MPSCMGGEVTENMILYQKKALREGMRKEENKQEDAKSSAEFEGLKLRRAENKRLTL